MKDYVLKILGLNEEIEKDRNKWKWMKKTFHAHGLEELISLKCPYFPKQYTDSMPFKIPTVFLTETEQF